MNSLFKQFVETHQVFATSELQDACGAESSTSNALSRAVSDGRVVKVRKGLYVSNTGRFIGLRADPYRIAATFDPAAIFSFHSALELHGLAHSLSNRVQFRATNPRLSFKFDNNIFERYLSQNDIPTDTVRADSYGVINVTTREQTFLDCMNRMRLCGSAEEVLHSLAGLPYLNLDTVEELLLAHPASVSARAGWYLEANKQRWNVNEALLNRLEKRLAARASYHLDSSTRKGAQAFSARWKLNLPASLDETKSWMEL